ncbi:MAG: alpha/beta hydrolase [Verrucomicrobiota bacterium]
MHRTIQIGIVSLMLLLAQAIGAAEPLVIPLWPADKLPTMPDAKPEQTVERSKTDKPDRSTRNVTQPTLAVYPAPAERATGAAVVICPGGGYGGLAIDKEGHDVARWLNSNGIAGVVLKYRMPRAELSRNGKPWPLLDAARAVRLARAHASEWGLDPQRVGIMGFSAGGHLAATLGTHWESAKPTATDALDKFSSRPDFLILVYPVISLKDPVGHKGSRQSLLGANADASLIEEYSNELHVNAETPPTFLVHAKDDGVKVENSLLFKAALEKNKVPCELVLFDKGGHGFGLGIHGGEPATWPERCAKWLQQFKRTP